MREIDIHRGDSDDVLSEQAADLVMAEVAAMKAEIHIVESVDKHYGPGPHRSTKTPQSVHGVRGSVSALFRRARAGGFTFSISGRRYPATGYAVAVAGNSFITPASSFTPDLLVSYLDTHSAKFSASPALHLGGWYDAAHDEMVLDLVEVFDNQDEAVQAGISRDEQAIFDLANGIEIPTHGSGGRHG